MKHFVQNAEEQLYLEGGMSQTEVTVNHNRSDVCKRRPESLKKEAELLRLETEKYVMSVYLERSELVENFINYTIYRKRYYLESEYHSVFESMGLMEELNSRDATVDDYYFVSTGFLTYGTESIVLMRMDYELVVPETFLGEYIEEVDNPGDDWYATLTNFLDTYTYDGTEEIQNELGCKQIPYQWSEKRKGQ